MGRYYFPGFDEEPQSAEEALQNWINTYSDATLSEEDSEFLFEFTDRESNAEFNIAAIRSAAAYNGIDLDALRIPLPVLFPEVTEDTLSDVMEFDTVIRVNENGTVDVLRDMNTPDLYDGYLMGDGWELLNGFSGQYGYSGPIMHESEFIGGGIARYILSTPGLYVSLVSYYTPETEEDDNIDGWAVAYKSITDTEGN